MSGDARGWAVLRSLLDIVVGVIVFVWPSISALALLYVIGAYAIILGIITIGGAFWLPFSGGDSALLVLTGIASIVFGIVMFAMPGDGALVLLALIAAFALVSGISELVVAIGGQRLLAKRGQKAFAPPRRRPRRNAPLPAAGFGRPAHQPGDWNPCPPPQKPTPRSSSTPARETASR
jgi:hypothetical protein